MSGLWFWITNYLNTTLNIEGQHSMTLCKTQKEEENDINTVHTYEILKYIHLAATQVYYMNPHSSTPFCLPGVSIDLPLSPASALSPSPFSFPWSLPLHMVWIQVSSNSVSVALLLARPQILFKDLPASIHFPRLLAYNPPYPLDWFGLLKSESNVQTGTLDLGPFGVWIVKPTVVSRLKSKHYSSG